MGRESGIIYCNKCGMKICTEEQMLKTSFLTITKEWGYFSHGKDGMLHSMDICEPCYDSLAESFVIPPKKKKLTELV